MTPSIRNAENYHIILWLVKDLCWVQDWKLAGAFMILPTLSMALWITWRCRGDVKEFLHALAVVLWIAANATWMVGEFFFEDRTRPLATLFFLLGLACIAWFYLFHAPRARHAGNIKETAG
ncbi:MAG: hypothetical protein JNM31_06245 [Flavobacteriales bacterium]|nr:hypothetical protein [Flavobacteriales bacterium]